MHRETERENSRHFFQNGRLENAKQEGCKGARVQGSHLEKNALHFDASVIVRALFAFAVRTLNRDKATMVKRDPLALVVDDSDRIQIGRFALFHVLCDLQHVAPVGKFSRNAALQKVDLHTQRPHAQRSTAVFFLSNTHHSNTATR
jgi:hypothetical protein